MRRVAVFFAGQAAGRGVFARDFDDASRAGVDRCGDPAGLGIEDVLAGHVAILDSREK